MKTLNKILIGTLIAPLVFSFAGQAVFAAGPATVNLGTAGNFVILAKTGISTTGPTSIIGDLGISPAAATYITGFGLNLPMASTFSTSALVNGKIYAPGYANPTPANLTTAVLDMQNAYTDAAGRAPNVTELGAGNIGGLTLAPGVYKWGTGVTIPTDVTLSGGANDVWIFEIAQNLNISSATKVVLAGSAQAGNIFWVVAGQTTLGTTSVFNGNILDQTSIVLNTGAQLNGRALAQAAVTLDSNNVTVPTVVMPMGGYGYVTSTPVSYPYMYTPAPTATSTQQMQDMHATLQSQLNGLMSQLQTLQAQQGSAPAASSTFGQQVKTIMKDLQIGNKNSDVSVLQQFLISQGKGPSAQALAKNGATTYFGALTRSALMEFQKSVGITPASGYFGVKTRSYINSSIK